MITDYRNIIFTRNKNQSGCNNNDALEVSVYSALKIPWKQDYRTYHVKSNFTLTEIRTTGCKFPGSQNVNYKTSKAGFWLTRSHLVKNDLNGHFLTDQPGQPFNVDPGNTAGFDLPPPPP